LILIYLWYQPNNEWLSSGSDVQVTLLRGILNTRILHEALSERLLFSCLSSFCHVCSI